MDFGAADVCVGPEALCSDGRRERSSGGKLARSGLREREILRLASTSSTSGALKAL